MYQFADGSILCDSCYEDSGMHYGSFFIQAENNAEEYCLVCKQNDFGQLEELKEA